MVKFNIRLSTWLEVIFATVTALLFFVLVWWYTWDVPVDLSSASRKIVGFVFFLGIAVTINSLKQLEFVNPAIEEPRRSSILYNRFLVAQAAILIVMSLASGIGLAGLVNSKVLPLGALVDAGTITLTPENAAAILCVSIFMSIVGAIFFNANAMYSKQAREGFLPEMFWAGFWFRVGEAIVFTLVIFLFVMAGSSAADYLTWLPVYALLMGMFVSSGEVLVFGTAHKLFEHLAKTLSVGPGQSVATTTPRPPAPSQAPPAAPPSEAAPEACTDLKADVQAPDGEETLPTISISWNAPATGIAPTSYQVIVSGTEVDAKQLNGEVLETDQTSITMARALPVFIVVAGIADGVQGAPSEVCAVPEPADDVA